ncbi:nectin cell adhesion molecule 4, transcript variant X2 [Ictidomys tridecemlineatus]|uniref:Nectin-4 n=1 Tax=Ictidomys tridecemlineatus TaxID=43179 RepID=A0A287CWL2_ICTTR|nr:nectin-4 isoform X2 [Ictidomys tridecemlineatus]KAG3281084.1 nectin cell adhesion molecule 4, transcript variant X2 [Ictidomys tridecemlineatus]
MPLSLGAEMWGPEGWLLLLFLASFTGQCPAGVLETTDLITVVLGQDAKLPCFYRGNPEEKVEQVAWARMDVNEGAQELALLNSQYGLHTSSAYKGRVEQPPPPRDPLDGSVLLRNAVQADEGEYECRVSTFPSGSFQARLRLRVLVPPLPSLIPGPPLEEGQGLTLAASCTAEGSPAPQVSWDTEVKGTPSSRSFTHSRSAAVTSEFHLVPSRSMNGQPLTCVVSHPGLLQDQRITHTLQVAFLAEASVRGLEDQKLWHVGREGAMLKCLSEGQPPPSYNWTRLDGPLPSGVRAEGNTLGFPPLTTEHSGTYVCHVSNELSSRDSQVTVNILDPQDPGQHVDLVSASVVVVGVIAALLFCLLVVVVILMSRYHRRKAQQMTQKYEEELTLTRENSIRRLHSHHTDPRSQPEESVGLRAEGHPDSLKDNSSCSVMSEEPEGRSYSTLTTVREIETQTELLSPGSGRAEEEEDRDEGIKQAMNHFVQENGTLRAKPTGNGIYINGRGHLV